MKLYTVAEIIQAELRSESLSALMDKAGTGLAEAVLAFFPEGRIGIFCGSGNNGGDGYVCALRLMELGRDVRLWAIGQDKLPEGSLVKNAADAFLLAGGVILPVSGELAVGDIDCGLLVDCLFGTGLSRPVSGLYAHGIELINESGVPVLSCDVPSGVNADTGEIMGMAVRADKTMVIGMGKMACALSPGMEYFGEQEFCDIGLSHE